MNKAAQAYAQQKLKLLSHEREKALDDITLLAASITQSPLAFISFVDHSKVWFKSQIGFTAKDADLDGSFCAEAIKVNDFFTVEDASVTETFARNCLVQEGVRFYAGIPICIDHVPVGSLGVCDYRNRSLSSEQIGMLKLLGKQIERELEHQFLERSRSHVEEHTHQHLLQSVLDNCSSVIYFKDIEGRFILVNSAFEKAFHLQASEIIGKTDLDLSPKEYAETYMATDRYIAEHNVQVKEENTALHNGEIHTYITAKFPIHDDRGVIRGIGGISTDVTLMKRAESEKRLLEVREKSAIEASRMKSEFLANMSHEIRTPINGVIGMTGLLLETSLNDEQRDFADTIRRSGENLLTIINDILDFSKIEAGKLDFESVDFDLWEVIQDSQKTMHFAATKKELTLEQSLNANLPKMLRGDAGRLKQVFLNLLKETNGVAHLRFEVEDSGIGLSDEDKKKMFQPFSQADASTHRRFGGTGLGLSICKRLIDHWDGRIGVQSTLGVGSTFWFEIFMPLGLESSVMRSASSPSIQSSQKKFRILVAEDNSVNQTIAVRMLQKLGYYADVAANGHEALDALRNAPYDLVLMDCQMPECDGYEATRLIRQSTSLECRDITILAMTANAMSGDTEKCLAAGMDGYLSKPISLSKLEGVLETFLNKKKR
jgi:PAS domain S-box-containing protein